ncbi:MAG: T9SS type A sorting domain-containing protein [Bacteroidales bacterium]|nr:T9SS type A sorting domain-containing protein [Bacteroidales bacterium]
MKTKFTLRRLFSKKENLLIAATLSLLFVFGCYEFKIVDQPTEGATNSYFEVDIVMVEDDDDSNDWTSEAGDLTKTGLFGILLPEGWTVQDNIELHIETADSLPDGAGGYVYATSDHDADYVITYNEGQTQRLNDSTSTPPTGYYWWGATSADPVDMAFFDSLYFTVKIYTDDQQGEFYLQYAIGDVDDWKRNPYDIITDPLPITISVPDAVNDLLTDASLSVYPNPSYGYLNVSLEKFNGEPVEVTMYNIRGKEVLRTRMTSAQSSFDIVDFAPGTYVIRMESGDETATRKFVKK